MQLPAGLVKIVIGVSLAVSLQSCDSVANSSSSEAEEVNEVVETQAVDDANNAVDNPCLESWVIQGIKDKTYEHARHLVTTNQGFNERTQVLLNNADISLSYISEPVRLENGGVSCTAQSNIRYLGDGDTRPDLITQVVNMTSLPAYANSPISMGIDSYNINEFNDMQDNGFSIKFDYEIGTTYSENGEKNESYNARIGGASAMLASMIALDNRNQIEVIRKEQAPARLAALKADVAAQSTATRERNLKAQNEILSSQGADSVEPDYVQSVEDSEVVVID